MKTVFQAVSLAAMTALAALFGITIFGKKEDGIQ